MAESIREVNEEKWITHYSSSHKILLVGEGDFSFSACLARAFGSAANMVAASLNSREEVIQMYNKGYESLKQLEDLGCCILHGVDAHTMSQHPVLSLQRFDRIVFNFPHTGFPCTESHPYYIKRHRELVRGFLRNAGELSKEDGEVHITHKTAHPYSQWEIEDIADTYGLYLFEKVNFCITDYEGYKNKRGSGHRAGRCFPVGECSTFKFRKLSITSISIQ